jgi:hypothetical protein
MSNWIDHVKKYQSENNVTYKEALIEASKTYQKGGSLKSEMIKRFIYKKGFDGSKVNNPSDFIQKSKQKSKYTKQTEKRIGELELIVDDLKNLIESRNEKRSVFASKFSKEVMQKYDKQTEGTKKTLKEHEKKLEELKKQISNTNNKPIESQTSNTSNKPKSTSQKRRDRRKKLRSNIQA